VTGWRFAFSARWIGYLGVVVVFAVACYFLALWQLARSAEVQAAVAKIEANYDAQPSPVEDILPTHQSYSPDQEWTPVVLHGSYLSQEQVLVRNRPRSAGPGFDVLTPLRLDDGSVFIVDRGWVPVGSGQDAPDAVPAAPKGPVSVVARLKASEPIVPGRQPPPAGSGQVGGIQLGEIAKTLDAPTYTGAYGLMASEEPAPSERPAAAPKPTLDQGLNLSYAIQWCIFGILGFFGLGYAIRQEYRRFNSDDPDERVKAEERARRRANRPPTDAEAEDAILEASGARAAEAPRSR
jgi:cytochrome oxidase assembly protein ShyY1